MDNVDDKLINILDKLPNNYWDFKNVNTKEYTHGLHNYPAVMIPSISRNIIRIMKSISDVQSLFDPFSGSGTVLVEGMLAGINNVSGNDINPLALFLEKVKTTPINIIQLCREFNPFIELLNKKYIEIYGYIDMSELFITKCMRLDLSTTNGWGKNAYDYLRQFCNKYDVYIDIPNFKNMGYWFKPKVILELSLIKSLIKKINDKDIRDFFFLAFSETVRLVSNRRNGEFKMYRMESKNLKNYNPKVKEQFISILKRNIIKMNEFNTKLQDKQGKSQVSIYNNSVCDLSCINDRFDLIITSPPYGDSRTTVAYGEFSRLSLQWIDLFNIDDKEIMKLDSSLMGGTKFVHGFEYNLNSKILYQPLMKIMSEDIRRAGDVYSFYLDLEKSIEQISNITEKNGYQFWVVGNRTVRGNKLDTDKIIAEIGERYSLQYVYSVDRYISNKRMPLLNSPTNNIGNTNKTMDIEHIVILRKY